MTRCRTRLPHYYPMITIDEINSVVHVDRAGGRVSLPMDSPEAFEVVSKAWLRCGWDSKYVYTFTWFGRPVIQLPEDLIRAQEVIYQVKPDVLIETGVAHGGSLIFYASLFKSLEKGRVVGVDIEIRPHNRAAIEKHVLKPWISLIEGSSIDPGIVAQVAGEIRSGETVMVILDSNHSKAHVLAELHAYAPLVTSGSYIVASDGIMQDLTGAPRSQPDWNVNNPRIAVDQFLRSNDQFEQIQPPWLFNESAGIRENVTYWPGAWLRRK